MRPRLLACLPVFLLLTLAVVGCGDTTSSTGGGSGGVGASNTIHMNATQFTQHSITVPANAPVTFSDTVNGGGTHILCLGTGNGGEGTSACDKSGNVPSGLLSNGTMFSPGQTKSFTFTTAGTYHIICTIHPGLYIDITVH